MGGVVKSRLRYAIPAAAVAALVFLAFGGTGTALDRTGGRIAAGSPPGQPVGGPGRPPHASGPRSGLHSPLEAARPPRESLRRGHRISGPGPGLRSRGPGGLLYVDAEAFRARGLIVDGMESAIGIVVFTFLLMGVLGGLEASGTVDALLERQSAAAMGPRSAEVRMFAVVSGAVLLTTHSVVAILAAGARGEEAGREGGSEPVPPSQPPGHHGLHLPLPAPVLHPHDPRRVHDGIGRGVRRSSHLGPRSGSPERLLVGPSSPW